VAIVKSNSIAAAHAARTRQLPAVAP
jgi:hypothetical protein